MFRGSARFLKSCIAIVFLLLAAVPGLHATDAPKSDAPKPGEPTDPKARKSFASAMDWDNHQNPIAALSDYRKANELDGGHCIECLNRAFSLAIANGKYDDAEEVARDWLLISTTNTDKGMNHFRLAVALQWHGINEKKDKWFAESCDEFKTALELEPRLVAAHFAYGVSLAHLHQDDAARAEFAAYLERSKADPDLHVRAKRYLERIELVRAKMAPPFSLTTLDGKKVSMDGLAGKVVLVDFWAIWCAPCREAVPHIRSIAKRFEGQPFVVISISLDKDEAKWKDFVAKNGMTWMQYRNAAGFEGNIAKQFSVTAIPATFTIDSDGVLEDQQVGDADIEGKLKKLIARAAEVANRKPASATTQDSKNSDKASNGLE
jgi:thiol-disulfide isomerase/thioredoxin